MSNGYEYLKKLADLEKIIESESVAGKTKDTYRRMVSPISPILKERMRVRIPVDVLNKTIDDGTHDFVSHVHKHKIILRPEEALYHAMGRKDPSLYDMLRGITLGDILDMAKNKHAIKQMSCRGPFDIADNDVPRHIGRIAILRGTSEPVMRKLAFSEKNMMRTYKIELKGGEDIKLGEKFVRENIESINTMIDDGMIVKVMRMYDNGKGEKTLYKSADVDIRDSIYLSLIYGC